MTREEQLIEKLSKEPPMVIETAYLYATNYTKYGENVTEKWVTAVQQSSILEKAYRQGYCDAMKEYEKRESEAKVTETSMHHLVCAMCDNDKCVRGTKECEFEKWKEEREREKNKWDTDLQ